MFDKYVIRLNPDNNLFGKWICHLDSTDWREYTTMWDNDIEALFKFVAGMGGHVTGWTTRDNEIILTVTF